jgi:hypothetical protein
MDLFSFLSLLLMATITLAAGGVLTHLVVLEWNPAPAPGNAPKANRRHRNRRRRRHQI